MTNAANPRSVTMGDFSQLSVRSVRCGICRPVGEKTPVAVAVGGGCAHYGFPFDGCCAVAAERAPVRPSTRRSLAMAAETLVVDVPPEIGVVLRIRDGDLLTDMRGAD